MPGTNPMERPAPVDVEMTIDRINYMLKAEGMPPCQDFTRSIPGISREAQACGALERKYKLGGLQTEHLRYHMVGGVRTKMLLGERVMELLGRTLPTMLSTMIENGKEPK